MASGWLAAVTVNTALADSRHQAMAWAFYAAREAETYAQFLALTRQHLRDGAPSDHPFWADRAAPVSVAAGDRAEIQAAYDRIRSAPELRLRVAPGVRFDARPALTERAIVLERHLVPPGGGDALRHLHGIDLVALAELAPRVADVPAFYDAYVRRMGPADLPSFLTALATAVARGWLSGV